MTDLRQRRKCRVIRVYVYFTSRVICTDPLSAYEQTPLVYLNRNMYIF